MPYPNGMSDFDRGLVLGLFEGEGFIALNRSFRPGRKRPYFTVHLGVVNNSYELLARFQSMVGFGEITSKPKPAVHHRQGWCLRSTRQAENLWLLETLFDDLIVKRDKAELMIPFLRGRLACNPQSKANWQRAYTESDLKIFETYTKLDCYKPAGRRKEA